MRSDLDQFRTAVRFQLRAYVRTWRFLGLLFFVAAVTLALLGVDVYRGADAVKATSPTASDFLGTFLGFLTYAVVVTAAFLGGDALAVDLSGGPGYLMLTLPVRRRVLLFGRFVAAALAGIAVALVYYAIAAASTFAFYGTVPVAIVLSFGGAILFGLAALAVAFFFSSFFKTPAVAVIASLLILLLALPVLTVIGTLTGSEPWFSLDYGAQIVSNVLASDFVHEKITTVPGGQGRSITIYQFAPYLWEGVAILVGYLAVFLALTFGVYRYREVKG